MTTTPAGKRGTGKARGQKTTPRTIAIRQKQERAVKLRALGMGFTAIAAELGYTNPGSAYKAVQAVLGRAESETAEELRLVHSDRLLVAYREVLPILQAEIVLPEFPASWNDWDPMSRVNFLQRIEAGITADRDMKLKAADRLVRLMERESKLHGLDAPARSDVTSGGEATQVVFHSALNPDGQS